MQVQYLISKKSQCSKVTSTFFFAIFGKVKNETFYVIFKTVWNASCIIAFVEQTPIDIPHKSCKLHTVLSLASL